MTCKCGKEAELKQENIFGEVDELCRDCFNSLGEPPREKEQDFDIWVFDPSWLGGMAK